MYCISRKEKEEMIKKCNNIEYSHVLICMEKYTGKYFPRYVSYQENINELIEELNYDELDIEIVEIYNYNIDITYQLNQQKSYNIDPIIQKSNGNSKMQSALEFANKMHKGQTRKDGTPYVMHPIRVANYVSKFKESKELPMLITCAYLHDTIEDTKATYYDICDNFGAEVAHIVTELTTDKDMKNLIGKQKYLSLKMKNMTSWSLVIKLCDRLDNVTDLATAKEEFRLKYINETLGILNYLIYNRKDLSSTHLTIMTEIMDRLIFYNQYYDYADDRMYNLQNSIIERQNNNNVKQKVYAMA